MREFMNDCAIKRAEVVQRLDLFYQLNNLANQLEAQGDAPKATRTRTDAAVPLAEAQRAADKLIAVGNGGTELLKELNELK